MTVRSVESRVGRVFPLTAAVATAIGLFAAMSVPAEARHRYGFQRHHHVKQAHAARPRHHAWAGRQHRSRSYAPTTQVHRNSGGFLNPSHASIIVDANTGKTLSAQNENAPHHPASVTKVMTLYLLFEQLEKGRLALDSDLEISAHAAAQSPTKLGLRPGATIEVEDAIKALVTKSANDIAVAIAENIAGDEDSFAALMTRRARSLGMNGTTFKNASGLPNPQQITTARDLSILGRAVQDRFPRYYKYFSTHTFYFAGRPIRNHNNLLGRVEGMDGIKTGYTAASGFNLLTSVKRGGRYIVGVVLGGRTAAQRDHTMAGLIEENLGDASTRRTAVAVVERDDNAILQSERVMESAPDDVVTPARKVAESDVRPPAVVPDVRTETRAPLDLSVPTRSGKLANRIDDKPRPAFVTATPRDEDDATDSIGRGARRAAGDGSTGRTMAYAATPGATTPSSLRWVEGAGARGASRVETARTDGKAGKYGVALVRPNASGWMIQIGAADDVEEARELITRAKAKAGLASAKAFTEKVQKGRETLWRARFAGLDESGAETACRTLKRSGFSCFATKN